MGFRAQSAKFGSTVFVIGVGKDYQSLPFMHMSANEIDLKLQYRYASQYPKAIRQFLFPQKYRIVPDIISPA